MVTNTYISGNCPHKLPCGLCRLTMTQCPKSWWSCTTSATSTAESATINASACKSGNTTATLNNEMASSTQTDCGWN